MIDTQDRFDGEVELRRYNKAEYIPKGCEFLGVHDNEAYTLTRLTFEGRDTYMFIVKGELSVSKAENGTFAKHVQSGAELTLSVGGGLYYVDDNVVQVNGAKKTGYFAGISGVGELRLIPKRVDDAVDEEEMEYGVEARPFLVVNGNRMRVEEGVHLLKDRLVWGELQTGEKVFIYIKSVSIGQAIDYVYQLGCRMAAVVGNGEYIDIYSKEVVQDRQKGARAVFMVKKSEKGCMP